MKKIIAVAAAILVILLVVGGALFWYMMGQPMYTPGMVRAGQNLRASLVPPARSGETSFWAVEKDIKLYHFSAGEGKNVLVVHGGPGFPFANPLPGLAALTDRYRFTYYDQRGAGKSSRPFDRFTSSNSYENMTTLEKTLGLGAQIADIERIRQLLGEDKLILVGHSFGGFLASLYAAEFPERVQALILIAPAETLVMPQADGGLFAQIRPLLSGEMQKDYDAYLTRYLDYGSIFSRSEAELSRLNAEFARYYASAASRKGFTLPPDTDPAASGGWMVHAMYISMGQRHDYRNALKQVNAPVLVVHGEKDLQSEQASRLYADLFPNAEFRVIADAGHFSFDDQPAEFARVVGVFLDRAR